MQQFPPHTILCTSYAKRRKICVPSEKMGRKDRRKTFWMKAGGFDWEKK
jgi:hypothetical protein